MLSDDFRKSLDLGKDKSYHIVVQSFPLIFQYILISLFFRPQICKFPTIALYLHNIIPSFTKLHPAYENTAYWHKATQESASGDDTLFQLLLFSDNHS